MPCSVQPVAPITNTSRTVPFRFPLIQRLPVAFYSDGQNDEGEERDLPKLKRDIDDAIPF